MVGKSLLMKDQLKKKTLIFFTKQLKAIKNINLNIA